MQLLKLLLLLIISTAYADDTLLIATKELGSKVYYNCIVTPPVTASQQAACDSLYTAYMVSLTALNAPLPLVLSIDPDPYVWSAYDICRYETGHMVFGEQTMLPYCPTV